jgi:hypothetical protein
MDFDRLVRVLPQIETPAGFASLEAFNRALSAHVLAHPSLKVRSLLFAAGWSNSSLFFLGLFCPAGGCGSGGRRRRSSGQ